MRDQFRLLIQILPRRLAPIIGIVLERHESQVVEAAAGIGGATALSGGSFMAAGTPAQAEAGYPGDTVDDLDLDTPERGAVICELKMNRELASVRAFIGGPA